jgi:YHS domain-containing protein
MWRTNVAEQCSRPGRTYGSQEEVISERTGIEELAPRSSGSSLEESMNFLARIMRFLFWLLIVSWSVALLRRVLAWMLRGAMPSAQTDQDAAASAAGAGVGVGSGDTQSGVAARRLVRDPVCGMHVAEVLAVPLRESGELVHFCSLACRDKYVNGAQRMAANG